MNISIRLEEERDHEKVEFLTREAFWDKYRPGCFEHLVVHKIRKVPAFIKELSYVACEGDDVVGNIIYSRAAIVNGQGKKFEVLSMGPFAVAPSFQKQGVGGSLLEHSLRRATELGFRAVVIFGDPGYYHQFGFADAKKYGITTPSGENFAVFMTKELYDGALRGISGKFYHDPVFEVKAEELEAFDKGFPYKEKHVTDTQLK
jgi:predicted N-acetyltransferase YhbS